MEASSLEDIKVLETIEDILGILFGDILLLLILKHKFEQVIHAHVSIF